MPGWIKIERDIQNHWIWQDEKYFRWWMTILLNVNHEAKKFPVNTEIFTCKPGESFRSIDDWSKLFRCSKPTVFKFFALLKNDGMIQTKIVGRGNRRKHLLTVVNWQKYQQTETRNFTENKPETLPKVNPNKNDKNKKKEKEAKNVRFLPPSLDEIQSYFSTKISEKNIPLNPKDEGEKFESFYASKNWYVGKNKMTDWKKAVSGWITRAKPNGNNNSQQKILANEYKPGY